MNWYKTAQDDIEYLGNYNFNGADCVQFRIGGDYYVYKLKFQDDVVKVKQMAHYSHGKALNWAKKNASMVLKVTEDFPAFGSIIREVD